MTIVNPFRVFAVQFLVISKTFSGLFLRYSTERLLLHFLQQYNNPSLDDFELPNSQTFFSCLHLEQTLLSIFNDSFDYIEQATGFINEILDAQEKGEIPHSVLFLWDSIGSIPCKMTYEGRGGKMANASVLSDTIGMGIHSRISKI